MHGLGNDYVCVDCFAEQIAEPAALARLISDRHRGVGGDGLILMGPSAKADVRMDMYNADGSRGQMCGNGIRCVAKYAYDHGITVGETDNDARVHTDAEGAGSQGRHSGEEQADKKRDEGQSQEHGIHRDDDGQLHVDLEA